MTASTDIGIIGLCAQKETEAVIKSDCYVVNVGLIKTLMESDGLMEVGGGKW